MESWEDYENLNEDRIAQLVKTDDVPTKISTNTTKKELPLDKSSIKAPVDQNATDTQVRLYMQAQPTVRILSRKTSNTPTDVETSEKTVNTQQSQQKSFEEREREYLEARKRILGSENPSNSPVSPSSSETRTLNDQKRTNNPSKNLSNNSRSSNHKGKNNFSSNSNENK